MTPEQEAKEREVFETWEYKYYGPVGLIDGHSIAIKAWLERARLAEKENEKILIALDKIPTLFETALKESMKEIEEESNE